MSLSSQETISKTVVLGEASEDSDEDTIVIDSKQVNSSATMRIPITGTIMGAFGKFLFTSPKPTSSPLNKTLVTKNKQFHACMTHLYRHPYEKACKDINLLNQGLVKLHKDIQEIDIAVTKIKRERKNLDMDIDLDRLNMTD